ncbi:putative disease resistance protein RGA3 [Chenopodium quinoa]|uniref:putative disease resistance protein RGA3 n=1 Tax=Chenopodium quinoa TaxID=63459 RepID=UPI000B7860ED|nr:putative disease resistance protein RGA3 [Chenopodium quinoa]
MLFDDRDWIRWEDISGVRSSKEILRIIDHQSLDYQKYLLVLEDISNEDGEKWFDLLKPLLSTFAYSMPGSKILVTSSSTSLQPHVLHKLPLANGAPFLLRPLHHADYLAFFQSIAFREVGEQDINSHLRDISLEILKRCNNNPHVIRIVALILSSQPLSKWQYFSEVVHNVHDLAKQILSIHKFYQLWDAQQKFTEPFKEVIEALLGNKNLFDSCRRDKNGLIIYYKVRVLVHEVAKKSCEFITIPNLSLMLENNKGLQALDLAVVNCKHCLNSIGELQHLRYLRLGFSSETLPECISNLDFLQTLDLRHSRVRELPVGFHKLCHLKHLYIGDILIDLPPRFGELTELQSLDAFIVGNNNGLDALAHLTQLAGKLKICYQNGHEEHVIRKGTPFLKGRKLHELSLEWPHSNVEAAAGTYQKEDDMQMELFQLPSTLKFLTAKNWKGERFPKWAMNQFSSLLSNLVFIHIADCSRCKHLPFFSESSCLKSLELWGLIALEWIETGDNNRMVSSETPYFPSLQHLSLVNLPQLKGWTRVEEHDANREQDKHDNHQYVSCLILPHLYNLRVSGCSELKSMPQMPNLQSLEASNCHGDLLLHLFGAQASSVSSSASPVVPNPCQWALSASQHFRNSLSVGFIISEIYQSQLDTSISFASLSFNICQTIADLPESMASLSALEHVEIQYCPKLKQVPKYFSDLTSLQRLEIKECVNLERRCQQPDGEDWILI